MVTMDEIVSLCKRRGFIFQSSEIYGGLNSCWDYGPLGVEMKNNIKRLWWKANVQLRDDVVGLDSSILMNPKVWEASGHLSNFADPMADCKVCKKRWRADQLSEYKCPECGGELTEARMFNLMFKTFMGPVEDESAVVYLRPETAQGIFVNFLNVQQTMRKKLPFGIAQIGKSFRNEITPGNFIFRTREFEQMEIEYFVKPGTDEYWHKHWIEQRINWYYKLGIKKENIRIREHGKDELAHYAKACVDIEYLFPMGWSELEGIANRTDFDLSRHQEYSGQNLTYFDDETKQRYIPYVIEPSAGVDRSFLAFLVDAYENQKIDENDSRIVLHLHPAIAPVKAGVFPLLKREELVKKAKEIYNNLKYKWIVQYDESGSIGKRYRRQDEIGTPFGITVDYQTLEDNTVTIRDRDTMEQVRVHIEEIIPYLEEKIEVKF
ncbi:glycyl-tRNA synthetase [Caldicellulosiruptor saccharolyticus DSM 8903]|uniref:Glycine--tRNA ligase n=2 Tax=Caldicellulosiruptor saccharolyticus TaxID=44001 RepID=A4XKV6_CALS8|nr:glycyl-tRNA synthetase [Caldicellulosiruptor saccharolyticus DSM 8903]